jgi:hypothetical protein
MTAGASGRQQDVMATPLLPRFLVPNHSTALARSNSNAPARIENPQIPLLLLFRSLGINRSAE